MSNRRVGRLVRSEPGAQPLDKVPPPNRKPARPRPLQQPIPLRPDRSQVGQPEQRPTHRVWLADALVERKRLLVARPRAVVIRASEREVAQALDAACLVARRLEVPIDAQGLLQQPARVGVSVLIAEELGLDLEGPGRARLVAGVREHPDRYRGEADRGSLAKLVLRGAISSNESPARSAARPRSAVTSPRSLRMLWWRAPSANAKNASA